MDGKELTLQEKIDRAKPGDIIWHVVEDPNPLVLMRKPTVTREWVHYFCAYINAGHKSPADDFARAEHAIKKLTEIGVKVTDD